MGAPGSSELERLIQLLGPRLDEVRSLVDDLGSRWRGDALEAEVQAARDRAEHRRDHERDQTQCIGAIAQRLREAAVVAGG